MSEILPPSGQPQKRLPPPSRMGIARHDPFENVGDGDLKWVIRCPAPSGQPREMPSPSARVDYDDFYDRAYRLFCDAEPRRSQLRDAVVEAAKTDLSLALKYCAQLKAFETDVLRRIRQSRKLARFEADVLTQRQTLKMWEAKNEASAAYDSISGSWPPKWVTSLLALFGVEYVSYASQRWAASKRLERHLDAIEDLESDALDDIDEVIDDQKALLADVDVLRSRLEALTKRGKSS